MKRSELNQIMQETREFIDSMNFKLPPFADWTPADWATKGHDYDEIRDNMLGWDITDFGSGDYRKVGLLMFTIRNGNFTDPKYVKTYCEKLLIVEEGQITPYHFHFKKMEDIINRGGGGDLVCQLYNSNPDGSFADTDVTVYMDGRQFTIPAGGIIRVHTGESVTFQSGLYHQFWAEGGKLLVGEVSKVNDDRVDNRFYDEVGRFPDIEEDVEPLYLLGNEYPVAKD